MDREKDSPEKHLSKVFICGRISGWVERNREPLETGSKDVELDLLMKLSPGFTEKVKGLPTEQVLESIKRALAFADESPLSATHYRPAYPGSAVWVRKETAPKTYIDGNKVYIEKK